MRPRNLLFIFSDEHTREITGCYGNDFIRTPNLDRLAARGTRFDQAYTNCPICVPARASLATGRYVNQIGAWDNAHPYAGEPRGWGHRLIEAGQEVTAIGKLHYRRVGDPSGFSTEIDTLHVIDGVGDLYGCLRRDIRERATVKNLARDAGPGDSTYIQYDTRTADRACRWLREAGARRREAPWTLFVGFVLPHFPLIAPPQFYELYPPRRMPRPRLYSPEERPTHPVLQTLRRAMAYDDYFDERRMCMARSAYFGMVSFLDFNVGRLLDALCESGLADDTTVVYTSDHGDNIGHRGLWGKSVMYEESVAVPLLMAGPNVPAGKSVDTVVSLVDLYQTIVEGAGLEIGATEQDLPGHSLYRIAHGEAPRRTVLSEYHAAGAMTGMFMIREGRWKYVHYVDYAPQLFDLICDPNETQDLGESADHREVLEHCETKLRAVVDPEAVNERAFRDQDAKVAAYGGEAAVRGRGDFGYTPAPGEEAQFG